MPKTFACRDVGVSCDWHTCADTDEEVLREVAMHAREDHGMNEISDEMMNEVKGAIKEGPCPKSVH